MSNDKDSNCPDKGSNCPVFLIVYDLAAYYVAGIVSFQDVILSVRHVRSSSEMVSLYLSTGSWWMRRSCLGSRIFRWVECMCWCWRPFCMDVIVSFCEFLRGVKWLLEWWLARFCVLVNCEFLLTLLNYTLFLCSMISITTPNCWWSCV